MKQETLEEAFNLFKEDYTILHKYNLHHLLQVARFGARWQAKRMYNKEKVDKLLDTLIQNNMCSVAGDELIEQFKNK